MNFLKFVAHATKLQMDGFSKDGNADVGYKVLHGWLKKSDVDSIFELSKGFFESEKDNLQNLSGLHWLLGQLNWRLGRFEEANSSFSEVVSLGGKNAEAAKRALKLVNQKKYF
jgi:hypothetical protein